MRDDASGEFTNTTAEAGQRLDACVAARLGCRRARVQHGIEHPSTGERLVFEAPLHEDISTLLDAVRRGPA